MTKASRENLTRRLERQRVAFSDGRREAGLRHVIFVEPSRTQTYRVELVDIGPGKRARIKARYVKTWTDAMALAAHWSYRYGVEAIDRHYQRTAD